MGTICLQCGDKGFTNAFIYCVKCLGFAVHRYCLDVRPRTFDEFVHWVCDDCEPKAQNQSAVCNHNAIPSQTGDHIVSENVKRTRKNDLLVVRKEEHVHEDSPKKSYDASTKVDLVNCGESAKECVLTQAGVNKNNDHGAIVLPEDERKICRKRLLKEKKEKGNSMQQTRFLKGALKKKRRITKSTMEKDEHGLGNTSCKKENNEHVKVCSGLVRDTKLPSKVKDDKKACNGLSCGTKLPSKVKDDKKVCTRLACDTKLPSKVKDDKGSEHRDQKCISLKSSKKKKKTVISSKKILQEKKHRTEEKNTEEKKYSPSKDHVKNGELEDRDEKNFANHDKNNLCEDIPQNLHISTAEPVALPIWTGGFDIRNEKRCILNGLLAHMSILACRKVYDEALQFQPVLQLEMLPKADIWPKSFETLEPRADNIALYFFPSKSSERDFDRLVDEMMRKELALKAIVQNAELLIFNSSELPLLYWKFQGKYYLWGVFRQKQSTPSNSHPCQEETKDKNPIKHTNKTSVTKKSCNALSPRSPLSNSASNGLHT